MRLAADDVVELAQIAHVVGEGSSVESGEGEGLGGPPRRSWSPAERSAATGSGARHPAREKLASLASAHHDQEP